DKEKPFYNVTQVAEILQISADRLRTYDEEKLVVTERQGKGAKRLYSELDVEWLKDVRAIIAKNRMNIYSFKLMLKVLFYISDRAFEEIRQNNHNDDIWEIFARIRKNPNFEKLNKS
ncbi:MAG: MerR family transcriptional regulator, partial [Candidatus Gastranaerophilales bacterium]|nr:MerR family transcriptional regulator [Candidatus Gastranaerophilales bacterium]